MKAVVTSALLFVVALAPACSKTLDTADDSGPDTDTDTDTDTDVDTDTDTDADTDTETDSGDECYQYSCFVHEVADLQDLEGYPCILKDLSIDASGLSGHSLPDLEWVGGYVHIVDTADLTDLTVLPALRHVGKELEIRNNEALAAVTGLESLERVGGLWLKENPSLSNLEGLDALESVEGDFLVNGNETLEDLAGLNSLAEVTGDLLVYVSYDGEGFPLREPQEAMVSLAGLESLEAVGGTMGLSLGSQVTELTPLGGLSSVERLRIYEGDSLSSLDGLQGLSGVLPVLDLEYIGGLHSLEGLDGVTGIDQLVLYWLDSIENLEGLTGIAMVEDMSIGMMSGLYGCDICDFIASLDTPPGDILVYYCGEDECFENPDTFVYP